VVEREIHADGLATETVTQTVTETKQIKSVATTYPQNWLACNVVKCEEQDDFTVLQATCAPRSRSPPRPSGGFGCH